MKEQLNRNPLSKPKLYINPEVRDKNIDDITIEDFELIGYNSHPTIKGKMAV
jgi:thymidylate synthase